MTPRSLTLLVAEDPFLVDIYLAHIMKQRTDGDALQGKLCLQFGLHADNLLPEHNNCLIDVHGVLSQAALAGKREAAGYGGASKKPSSSSLTSTFSIPLRFVALRISVNVFIFFFVFDCKCK